jgi:hypothetical protein
MLKLPARLKRAKPSREALVWPRHRRFVRSHRCCVPGCPGQPIEFAHYRSAANSGTGVKPHDRFGISLCRAHHRTQHLIGQTEFQRSYQIDMAALAETFFARSPDKAMKESLKNGSVE